MQKEDSTMIAQENSTLVSPCGIYCGDCPAHKVKDDPSFRGILLNKVNWNGVPCQGCRPLKGKCQFVDGVCETYACAAGHNVGFCFECADFPCSKFNPAADKAADLPHNIKLFALWYIKQRGVEEWINKTAEVKQRYFRGRMVIGKGPQLE